MARTRRRTRRMAAAAATAAAVSAATPAGAITAGFQCAWNQINAGDFECLKGFFTGTLTCSTSGSTAHCTRIDYSFDNPVACFLASPSVCSPCDGVSLGTHSNVNVTSPISWNSPDSLNPSGTVFPTAFNVSNGGQVKIQGIPDYPNTPDAKCTATFNVSWK